jgi:RNA polymerase sigma factor (sigma-70 family)
MTIAIADDATLARGVASGDASCLGEIYDRYSGPLLGFCRNMLRRPADAEDCLQDVFVIAATRLVDLREPDRLRSWLYSVARHECLARLDRRNREFLMDDVPEGPSTGFDQPSTATIDNELAALLRDMNAGLSDRDRLLLELADREQLTGDELAAAVGVPRATAYTLLMRARLAARNSLAALLVARTGRDRCPALNRQLTGWDGQLTALRRKQITRHIDQCGTCTEQRRRVATPIALLGEGTAFAAELVGLRTRILAAAADAMANAPKATWPGGWPPADVQLAKPPRRRWWLPLAILLGVLLLVGGGSAVLLTHDSGTPVATPITTIVAATSSARVFTSSATPTPSNSPSPLGVVFGPPPAAPAGKSAAPTPTPTTSSPKPTPTPTPTSSAAVTWVVTLKNGARAAALISVNGGAAQTCNAGQTCGYPVPNRASVQVLPGRGGTFTAPASCVATRTGVCSLTITANAQITIALG